MYFGTAGSTLCLIHCLLLPALIVFAPALAAFADESAHRMLVVALAAPALFAAGLGHRRHGRAELVLLFVVGMALLLFAAWWAEGAWETGLTTVGGLSLIGAHTINRYLCRRCRLCGETGSHRHGGDQ